MGCGHAKEAWADDGRARRDGQDGAVANPLKQRPPNFLGAREAAFADALRRELRDRRRRRREALLAVRAEIRGSLGPLEAAWSAGDVPNGNFAPHYVPSAGPYDTHQRVPPAPDAVQRCVLFMTAGPSGGDVPRLLHERFIEGAVLEAMTRARRVFDTPCGGGGGPLRVPVPMEVSSPRTPSRGMGGVRGQQGEVPPSSAVAGGRAPALAGAALAFPQERVAARAFLPGPIGSWSVGWVRLPAGPPPPRPSPTRDDASGASLAAPPDTTLDEVTESPTSLPPPRSGPSAAATRGFLCPWKHTYDTSTDGPVTDPVGSHAERPPLSSSPVVGADVEGAEVEGDEVVARLAAAAVSDADESDEEGAAGASNDADEALHAAIMRRWRLREEGLIQDQAYPNPAPPLAELLALLALPPPPPPGAPLAPALTARRLEKYYLYPTRVVALGLRAEYRVLVPPPAHPPTAAARLPADHRRCPGFLVPVAEAVQVLAGLRHSLQRCPPPHARRSGGSFSASNGAPPQHPPVPLTAFFQNVVHQYGAPIPSEGLRLRPPSLQSSSHTASAPAEVIDGCFATLYASEASQAALPGGPAAYRRGGCGIAALASEENSIALPLFTSLRAAPFWGALWTYATCLAALSPLPEGVKEGGGAGPAAVAQSEAARGALRAVLGAHFTRSDSCQWLYARLVLGRWLLRLLSQSPGQVPPPQSIETPHSDLRSSSLGGRGIINTNANPATDTPSFRLADDPSPTTTRGRGGSGGENGDDKASVAVEQPAVNRRLLADEKSDDANTKKDPSPAGEGVQEAPPVVSPPSPAPRPVTCLQLKLGLITQYDNVRFVAFNGFGSRNIPTLHHSEGGRGGGGEGGAGGRGPATEKTVGHHSQTLVPLPPPQHLTFVDSTGRPSVRNTTGPVAEGLLTITFDRTPFPLVSNNLAGPMFSPCEKEDVSGATGGDGGGGGKETITTDFEDIPKDVSSLALSLEVALIELLLRDVCGLDPQY